MNLNTPLLPPPPRCAAPVPKQAVSGVLMSAANVEWPLLSE